MALFKVEVLDKEGRAVPTADNLIGFKVSGAGALIGVGNGDPNCQESDKAPKRSLFNGLAQVIVQSTATPGTITVEAWTRAVAAAEVASMQVTDYDEESGVAAERGMSPALFFILNRAKPRGLRWSGP